jgi:CRP-like cAMP-binding protein
MNPNMLVPVARKLLSDSQTRGAMATDLSKALARGRPISWSDHELMCCEGDPPDAFFLVLRGRIRVLRNDSDGLPRELIVLVSPTLVGHMGMVDGSPRSATCEAVGDVDGLSLDAETFSALMDDATAEGTAFRRLILNHMMEQLSRGNTKIRSLIDELEGYRLEDYRQDSEQWRKQMRSKAAHAQAPSEADRLREIAGVLDGWDLKTEPGEKLRFVEDEEMRRSRKSRETS